MKEIKVKLPENCDIENVTTKIEDGCVVVLCESKRWRANRYGHYYSVIYDWFTGFHAQENREENCTYDNFAYGRGNYFKSKADAANVAKQMQAILDAFKNK
jgi:hypothetical protein